MYRNFTAVLGLHKRDNFDDYTIQVRVAKIIRHEKYRRDCHSNDIMLVKLEHPVPFSDAVSPVCLPASLQVFADGKKCYTSGWGYLEG